ncbi:hypothetical protein HRbin09_01963 [bacterium HR09]|nr:hypothetical protein HRbin09_01963 [bacterium HR09]
MPTSWYWKAVMGTMLPPTVCEVLKVVVGMGTRSPITTLPFSPSVMRSSGCARVSACPADLMRLMVTLGTTTPHMERVISSRRGRGIRALSALPVMREGSRVMG